MGEVQRIFDRSLWRQRRDRAAGGLDNHDFLLDRFCEDVEERLSLIRRTFASALVVGAHGGTMGRRLARRGIAAIVETETTASLLDGCAGLPVVADEEALPFADESFDLIIAPLTLQFVNDLPGALLQIRRALKPDGLFIGGLFGGATLRELRTAWLEAEAEIVGGASPRVAPFADVRDLGHLLQRAGFALPVADSEVLRVRYATPLSLMRELRAMGAGNVLADRRRVPVTRSLLMRAAEIYAERFSDADGRIAATFELMVMTGWAPHESQQKPLRPGSAEVRLADALASGGRRRLERDPR